jgi:hypothetical protein
MAEEGVALHHILLDKVLMEGQVVVVVETEPMEIWQGGQEPQVKGTMVALLVHILSPIVDREVVERGVWDQVVEQEQEMVGLDQQVV